MTNDRRWIRPTGDVAGLRMRIGCRITHELVQPTPLIALLNVHYSRFGDLEQADYLVTDPSVPLESYRDGFGNWCTRMIAPAGTFTLKADGIFRDTGQPDPYGPDAEQHAVQDLPFETLVYLLGSRYCDTDLLTVRAWALFGQTVPGWSRVQTICDYVHENITFDYMKADATRTAAQTLSGGHGVCRDFTHLAIAFCRCMNIPARYCSGYLSEIGEPLPHAPDDFAAWMEVYLGGQWWIFDPRNNNRRTGRILVARGRDLPRVFHPAANGAQLALVRPREGRCVGRLGVGAGFQSRDAIDSFLERNPVQSFDGRSREC